MINFWLELASFFYAGWALLRTQPLTIVGLLVSMGMFLYFIHPFLNQWRYEKEMFDKKHILESKLIDSETIQTGNISIENNSAPTQVNVGSPGSMQIINQQRSISREVKIEKGKDGNTFILRLVFEQTEGIWGQGVDLKLQVKTTGPFEMCRIVKGLPPAQFNVRISENKADGFYSYATTSAPIKNEPIIMEILSNDLIDVSQIGIEPLENRTSHSKGTV